MVGAGAPGGVSEPWASKEERCSPKAKMAVAIIAGSLVFISEIGLIF